ncbi:MAG: polysaccharide biosynthesis C-terminal domain-containing protein [Bacteroidetes bacterium]|nr:polysaccharide biosynthesis C-terminal domain-containing protein [Bacteroidota bacterium]
MLSQLCNSFFLATSHSKRIIAGSAAQTIINIVFDYVLIFGFRSFPEMGLNGAALASVFSEISYLFVASWVLIRTPKIRLFQIYFFTAIDWPLIKETFVKSSPLIVQYFLSIGAWEVFFIFVEHLGKAEAATSQILRTVFGVVGIAAWSLGATTNSMVSNLIGQKKEDEVIPLIHKVLFISLSFAFIIGLGLLFFPSSFLHMISSDEAIIAVGKNPLRIVVVATWMLSVSTVYFNAVLGSGQTRVNMIFEIIAIILYLGYCILVIELWRKPLSYAWASEFVYWFSLFAMSSFYIYSGRWRK